MESASLQLFWVTYPKGDGFPAQAFQYGNGKVFNEFGIHKFDCDRDQLHSHFTSPELGEPNLLWWDVGVGQYRPRIYRPICPLPICLPGSGTVKPLPVEHGSAHQAATQVEALIASLRKVLRTVEPVRPNLRVYGHNIRNLLIIAATECEAQWKAILRANGYQFPKRPGTGDYCKLSQPMRLADYGVCCPYAPEIGVISPFFGWDSEKPTESLPWYDDYNNSKHDRELSFARASLCSVIHAVAATVILFHAQFTDERYNPNVLPNDLVLMDVPRWEHRQCYVAPQGGNSAWIARPLW